MRGQPKRLSRNHLRRNGANVILYVLVSFYTTDVFSTLSRLFVRMGFPRLFCARLAVHYFAVRSVLGSVFSIFQRQRKRVRLCKRALKFFVHFLAVVCKRSQNNNLT